MLFPQIEFRLPCWMDDFVLRHNLIYPTVSDRMELVIELARLNIENGTGGPFGAAIFDIKTHKLLAPGVNLVELSKVSIAHAEMVAIMIGQKKIGSYDLNSNNSTAYELVTSAEPCAMCFGAIPWSGIKKVICGARTADVESIGFDEGAKPINWVDALKQRNISVQRDVLRYKSKKLIVKYARDEGIIYNGRKNS